MNPSFMLLLLLCREVLSQTRQFVSFRNKMEKKVQKIATKMEELYSLRCTPEMAKCKIKSFNSCEGIGEKVCNLDYPKPESCFDDSSLVSQVSAIKFPPNLDYNNLSNLHKSIVCSTAYLEETFHEIQKDRNKQFSSAYFGTKEGIHRFYPGQYFYEDGICDGFDPRFRPWYTIAASGAKNTLVLIDSTSHMKSDNKINTAKATAESIVRTLSSSHSISVLATSVHTQPLKGYTVKRASEQYKSSLLQKISSLSPEGQGTISQAFNETMSLLKRSFQEEEVCACSDAENVIFYVTDGFSTTEEDVKQLSELISSYNIDVILLIAAIGPNPNIIFLNQLACKYKGILIQIQNTITSQSEITYLINDFYQYLSVGVAMTKPIWTEPYEDFYGYGMMVTVSMPAYYYEAGKPYHQLLGVAGIDIVLRQFEKYHFESESLVYDLVGEISCLRNNLTQCQIESFRQSNLQCLPEDCSELYVLTSTSNFCLEYSSDLYLEPVTRDTDICCGLLTAEFVAILVVIFTVLITGVFLFCKRGNMKEYCKRLKSQRLRALKNIQRSRKEHNAELNKNFSSTSQIPAWKKESPNPMH